MSNNTLATLKLPKKSGEKLTLGQLHGSAKGYALAQLILQHNAPMLIITPDTLSANKLYDELRFFSGIDNDTITIFPDWETLPFDHFSPHQDITSSRLKILSQLNTHPHWTLILPISTLMHRMLDPGFLHAHSFVLSTGDTLDPKQLADKLTANGYRHVSQVMEHGEFSIRGALMDVFPMGATEPYRLDLFDNDVDSIRQFDPDTQLSTVKVDNIQLLPANEFPLDEAGITRFRQNWRARFEGNPANSPLYESISNGQSAPGIEYYLPLFYEQTSTLLDFAPNETLVVLDTSLHDQAQQFWREVTERYEQLQGDIEHPLLPPQEVFIRPEELFQRIKAFAQFELSHQDAKQNLDTLPPPSITIHHQAQQPYAELLTLLTHTDKRSLILAESLGRQDILLDTLHKLNLHPKRVPSWQAFLDSDEPICMTVHPMDEGLLLASPNVQIITESQLFGAKVRQKKRAQTGIQDPATIIRDLTELSIGAPVVHIQQGIGRYQGLVTLTTGDITAEYLLLTYLGGSKYYVPVSDLHLVSRYTGSDSAPLHALGNNRWEKIKQKAAKRVRDVAAELLNIYAQRAARPGVACTVDDNEYERFANSFPFEETDDQATAIQAVLNDLRQPHSMDRLVCGDVGFGKTEVAMRAAFVVAMNQKQVAMLVPTTLLCEQHFKNFTDRFSPWPIKVAAISRFRSKKDQGELIAQIRTGNVDIIIGTHKLLQSEFNFKSLGLLIIDEEHRFGVRQKEQIKALRANVDILTLTATPIPRTLNMSLTGMRDLSIIATPPARRLAINTFVRKTQNPLIREAILREITRGGQVYFLHNDVKSIERMAMDIRAMVPEAKTGIAHGQMREKQLEQVMVDFYHRRFNVLVCTTIIESGIDVPSANTIIIHRADKFGLAQLHQLRGRVGRSHHQAYAYLLTPEDSVMTKDAKKRLEAIATLGDLGSGFALATNDLEIRGAGELLGDEQSGHIQEIGFSLYMDMLDRAVKALQSGKEPESLMPQGDSTEVDLQVSALIPEDYLHDVKLRLTLYKRIANAKTASDLDDLRAEMIDRFGLLPEVTQHLFKQTHLKLKAAKLGIKTCHVSGQYARITLSEKPNIKIESLIARVQSQPNKYQFASQDQIRYTLEDLSTQSKFEELNALIALLTPDTL